MTGSTVCRSATATVARSAARTISSCYGWTPPTRLAPRSPISGCRPRTRTNARGSGRPLDVRPSSAGRHNDTSETGGARPVPIDDPIHIAIMLRVRKSHVAEFSTLSTSPIGLWPSWERGACKLCIRRPARLRRTTGFYEVSPARASARPSMARRYSRIGWLRSSRWSKAARSAAWSALEDWFRDGQEPMPPRWKLALLTWPAVWLSVQLYAPFSRRRSHRSVPKFWSSGVVTASVVSILTWIAMPLVVRVARPWLYPKSQQSSIKPSSLSHPR